MHRMNPDRSAVGYAFNHEKACLKPRKCRKRFKKISIFYLSPACRDITPEKCASDTVSSMWTKTTTAAARSSGIAKNPSSGTVRSSQATAVQCGNLMQQSKPSAISIASLPIWISSYKKASPYMKIGRRFSRSISRLFYPIFSNTISVWAFYMNSMYRSIQNTESDNYCGLLSCQFDNVTSVQW